MATRTDTEERGLKLVAAVACPPLSGEEVWRRGAALMGRYLRQQLHRVAPDDPYYSAIAEEAARFEVLGAGRDGEAA